MKVLIITSEPLSPEDTLPSTFELDQARLLSATCEVAICSVGEKAPLRGRVRAWARRALRRPPDPEAHRPMLGRVRCHVIDEVPVYEGLARPCDGPFGERLDRWLAAGRHAVSAYLARHGRPDVVHAHGRFLNAGALALAVKRSRGAPYVYTEHSTFYQRGLAPPEARPVLTEVIANAAVYSAVSPALAKAVEDYLGGPVEPARILPNVIDPLFEREPPRAPRPGPPFAFLQIASLTANKGVDLLIHAFAAAFGGDGAGRLDICGDGELRDDLQSLAHRLGVGAQVRFLGRMSKADVLDRIDDSHAVVVASHAETFGVVLIEAGARGRPTIATRCGGPETVVTPQTGRLVPAADVGALAAALKDMAEGSRDYDAGMIRASTLARFGRAAFLDRMAAVYREAAAA